MGLFLGYIRLFSQELCFSRAGVRLCAKQHFHSRNSTIELLHDGVGGAKLKKMEQSYPKQALGEHSGSHSSCRFEVGAARVALNPHPEGAILKGVEAVFRLFGEA